MSTLDANVIRQPRASRLWNRELAYYPERTRRRLYLLLVVVITTVMYYELYVGGGVATMLLTDLKIPFEPFVYILALSNLIGAFASLAAGLADRLGRANLVIYGQLVAALITLFGIPNATGPISYAIALSAIAFTEGLVLVATPALVRDFSPQMGRATAMGFWTLGPVTGSLLVSVAVTLTLPHYHTWQSQFYIAGIVGLVVFALAFLFLRELTPSLRDQLMVHERDRILVELKAKGLDLASSMKHSWRQILRADVVVSALGISAYLFFYYTLVSFGVIYLATLFHYSVDQANMLLNWSWGSQVVALVVIGMVSDKLRVRKPLMLLGSVCFCLLLWVWLSMLEPGAQPSFAWLTVISSAISIFSGMAYVTWMAGFTETVEAHNPALTATGLALYGWVVRIMVTLCYLLFPQIIKSVNPLLEAGPALAAYKKALAENTPPSDALLATLAHIKHAAAIAPAEWQTWNWICIGMGIFFICTIFVMRGRWSPAAAKRDQEAHEARVARELAELHAASASRQATRPAAGGLPSQLAGARN